MHEMIDSLTYVSMCILKEKVCFSVFLILEEKVEGKFFEETILAGFGFA